MNRRLYSAVGPHNAAHAYSVYVQLRTSIIIVTSNDSQTIMVNLPKQVLFDSIIINNETSINIVAINCIGIVNVESSQLLLSV